jgi:diguanylate cyclase (GGDEF)-like protein
MLMNKKKIGSPSSVPSIMLHGQIAFLSRHSSVWFWGNLFAASLFVLLRWVQGDENMPLLLIWYTAVVAIGAMRWLLDSHSPEALDAFGQRYLLYSTLISALWGTSGLILFSAQDLVQAVHVLLLVAAVVAAMPVLALSRMALYVQISITLLPITVSLLLLGDSTHHALAAATVLLGILLAMASRFVTHLLNDLHTAKLQMQEQAHTDPITQIPNRRFFDSIFKTEWRRAAREGKNIALLMIDVDAFKRYNDRHGHHAGDQCLQILAQCIKAVARRPSDVVARHGGEEFVILLPDTNLDDAAKLAERLRKSVEDQRIPHSDGAIPRIVTVSVGVSCCKPRIPQSNSNAEDAELVYPAMLLNAADRALYRAKRNGRNQVAKEGCGSESTTLSFPPVPAATHAA